MQNNPHIESLRGGLIVSCQAPAGSPLDDAYIISAMALTAERNGAVAVRINTPSHIAATKLRVRVPVIGIEKVVTDGSDVYITPTFEVAGRVADAGAEIIAVDATRRQRPSGERVELLIARIQTELRRPVMADIATLDEGLHAAGCGAAMVATTLRGYTAESRGARVPAFDLLENLARELDVPVICEGGIASPEDVRRAFDCGAFAVVAGTAITGTGSLTRAFVKACPTTPGEK
ncbi:MAG: N-acetylmannosamine-6-phosphate 2-epimerase [Blastocatellia bacterium]